MKPRVEAQVGPHREIEIQSGLLEHDTDPSERRGRGVPDVVAEHHDASRIGDEETAQNLEQGRLARAVWPQHSDELPARDVQADLVERLQRSVGLAELPDFQRRRFHPVHVLLVVRLETGVSFGLVGGTPPPAG